MPFPLFVVFLIGLSIIYTHLFNLSKGSIWAVLVLHATTDLAPRILNIQQTGIVFWIVVLLLVWLVAIMMTLLLVRRGEYIEEQGEQKTFSRI